MQRSRYGGQDRCYERVLVRGSNESIYIYVQFAYYESSTLQSEVFEVHAVGRVPGHLPVNES